MTIELIPEFDIGMFKNYIGGGAREMAIRIKVHVTLATDESLVLNTPVRVHNHLKLRSKESHALFLSPENTDTHDQIALPRTSLHTHICN